jgi:hypothetical protein
MSLLHSILANTSNVQITHVFCTGSEPLPTFSSGGLKYLKASLVACCSQVGVVRPVCDAKIPRKVTIASKRRQNSEAQPQRQLDQPRIDDVLLICPKVDEFRFRLVLVSLPSAKLA